MFSRYKKTSDAAPKSGAPAAVAANAAAAHRAPLAEKKSVSHMRPAPVVAERTSAEAVTADKEQKRKNRLMELKAELHKKLLENLNLAALENASEANLKAEIAAIVAETLEEMSVALNKDDRIALNQELYDEVMGLGPLETLLKDETVNDILVNGPKRIFIGLVTVLFRSLSSNICYEGDMEWQSDTQTSFGVMRCGWPRPVA